MALGPLVIQAGITMPGASAYALSPADLSPVVTPPFEPLASYDWMFGADYGDLSDAISGAKLQQDIGLSVTTAGSGYETSGALVFSGGGATTQATGLWFSTGGAITGVYITSPGAGYVSAPTVTAATSSGTGAVITPTLGGVGSLGSNSIILPTGGGKGLLTPVSDSQDQTMCAVIKVNKNPTGSGIGVVFGTLFTNSNPTGGVNAGSGLFLQGSVGYQTTIRPGGGSVTDEPTGISDGAFAFVALSEAPAGSIITYWGGPAPTVYTKTQVKTVAPVPPKLALGQGYYLNTGFSLEVAEFMIIPRATTQAELGVVYARSKARMAERGIAVY